MVAQQARRLRSSTHGAEHEMARKARTWRARLVGARWGAVAPGAPRFLGRAGARSRKCLETLTFLRGALWGALGRACPGLTPRQAPQPLKGLGARGWTGLAGRGAPQRRTPASVLLTIASTWRVLALGAGLERSSALLGSQNRVRASREAPQSRPQRRLDPCPLSPMRNGISSPQNGVQAAMRRFDVSASVANRVDPTSEYHGE